MITIGLKKIYKDRGRTMSDVADATGISTNTLSVLGRGDSKGIQFDTLDKICKELNCTPNDILNFKNTGYDFSIGKKPEKISTGYLFVGETLPTELVNRMEESGGTYIGVPMFIETSGAVSDDGTLVIFVGIPEASKPHFEQHDTPGTEQYSVERANKFYVELADSERDSIMSGAARMAVKYLPLGKKPSRVISIYAVDNGSTQPSRVIPVG